MYSPNDIQLIIDGQHGNGGPFWSREDGNIHAPNGRSLIDTLALIGELGATPKTHSILKNAIDFVFTYQTSDGCFKYSKNSAKLPCISARLLASLRRLGLSSDKRVKKSYQYLLDTQWSDGGWRCNTVKLGKSPQTDASNPGTTLYVLDAFRFKHKNQKALEQLNNGVNFLLKHWETRIPLGPCDFGMGSRFFQVEFPMLRYNLFYYVFVLSFYNVAHDDVRFKEAHDILLSKTINGKIMPENPHRAWRKFRFAMKGKVSKPATNCWLQIEKNINSSSIKSGVTL